ncbi:hypothetical protein K488DRAFT_44207 [Vararia minispora EC-137]|uniref:Uncharacterized protein n=1 Tax=Vararia minispora EC-137 TaxID=1314806 RepID=A0ACB8QU99_9AGAM|nr:hypothetical protein K488DRAFT_44207 [Vararia minispora EC-137]
MIEPIVFYDVPQAVPEGADPSERAWSPHTWKTRYALNMKKLPYTTTWIEYPDMAGELQKYGVAQEKRLYRGVPKYTVPTIIDPNTKRAVADSEAIALYLDDHYPDIGPRFFPPHTRSLQCAMVQRTRDLTGMVFRQIVYETWRVMTPRAQPYIRESREILLGVKLEDSAAKGEARKVALKEIADWLEETRGFIRANGEHAMFLGGERPVYADADIAGTLFWVRKVAGADSDVWRTIVTASEGHWAKFMEAFKEYETVA